MAELSKEDIGNMFKNPPSHPDPLMNFVAKVLYDFHKRAEHY